MLVDQESLAVLFLLNALDEITGIISLQEGPVNGKEFIAMADILGIKACKKTFAERKVMDRIQQVCFANTVVTDKAIDLPGKDEFGPGIIFKAGQLEFLQVHLSIQFP